MLATLLAAGAIPEQLSPETGVIDVPDERLAVAAKVQASSAVGAGIPFGAVAWRQPFDPADHLPFGISFTELLDIGETITAIDRIALSSAGAALGLIIDQTPGFGPIIDENGGRQIQLWFSVDPAGQAAPSFDAGGVQIPVTCRVTTSKSRRYERSAVLTVRQL